MTEHNTDLALVSEDDLSLVDNNILNSDQLGLLLKKTPAKYVKTRPAKGGGQWSYVSGGYIKKCLNLMFGWDWDFEIVDEMIRDGEVVVKGRLTCRAGGRTIVKMQYGNKEIVLRKDTKSPLSIGNDLKAAATDSLKKCAAELGIAADIYNSEEFKEIRVSHPKAKPDHKEVSDRKQRERVQQHIETAEDLDVLAMVEGIVDGDEELRKLYNDKKSELEKA